MCVLLLLCSFIVIIHGKVIPRDELEDFMDEVLFRAKTEMFTRKILPDHDYFLSYNLFGVPYELKFKTNNTVLSGPHELTRVGGVVGTEFTSGPALVKSTVSIGTIEVTFSSLDFAAFGIDYSGPAGMSVVGATVDVTIKVYRDNLVKCYISAFVTQPEGEFEMHLGDSDLSKLVYYVVEGIISKAVYPYKLLQDFVFPDITRSLEKAIKHSVKMVAC